ncbi:MAG: phosphoglycerate mutase [Bacteroidetes bacterium OLB9]|nr:MAG: phosphoglycerate mutase [Bacteroidetes bacterium OLB9]
MKFMRIAGWITLLVTSIFACKESVIQTPDYTGKEILNIQSNVIHLADNQQIVLNEDSIVKVFYLVRHAEKDTAGAVPDPLLSDIGLERAAKIADIMKGTRVDAIYSPINLRCMYTVDSLADIKAMRLQPYENKGLNKLIEKIKTSEDFNRIFMVGHSNTIPSIANTLAGKDYFKQIFDEDEYGNFIIVVLKKSGNPDLYALRY